MQKTVEISVLTLLLFTIILGIIRLIKYEIKSRNKFDDTEVMDWFS